jgi:clan AA aspartic protease (TIGR02281 family)
MNPNPANPRPCACHVRRHRDPRGCRGTVRVGYVILLLLTVSVLLILKGHERGQGNPTTAPPPQATDHEALPAVPESAVAASPAIESTGGADAVLTRAASGHFYASGKVNGFPVVYIVDTGATLVTLTPDQARNAGVTQCTPTRVRTASGINEGCTATIREVCFAQFCIKDAEVYISNGMVGEALLGMSVLRHFRISQQGDTMRVGL